MGDEIVIKEKPPLRYSLTIGLIFYLSFVITSFLSIGGPLSGWLGWIGLLPCLSLALILRYGSSLEISSQGICQRFLGLSMRHIAWHQIDSIIYRSGFPCPHYTIKPRNAWLYGIDLPIEDESFLDIKHALAEQGIILAQSPLRK